MEEILLIDDDLELCELLGEYLGNEGYRVTAAHDGAEGIRQALDGSCSLVVLDVMLPDCSGLEVLRTVRTRSRIPVLMLTARGEEVDRIVGLEMGADDYLAKPFNPRELLARTRAILRRTAAERAGGSGDRGPETLVIGDLLIDRGSRSVWQDRKPVSLTAVEFILLHELASKAGQVVHRDKLALTVLGRRLSLFDRSIDVHVSSLRRKLGRELGGIERIKAIRGVGYLYAQMPEGACIGQ